MDTQQLPPDMRHRIERLARSPIRSCRVVHGGCTAALRCSVTFENETSAFLKAATDPDTDRWLRSEVRVYEHLRGEFLPRFLGWDEGGEWPFMLLENLEHAAWPPPWTPARIDAVLAALATLRAAPPPPGLPRFEERRTLLSGWRVVAEDPGPFLALGLCSRQWLQAALPDLLAAEAAAVLDGDAFLHRDTRSDNLCFRDGRAVLIDWNHACLGNGLADLVAWLPSLHAEGGPPPEAILPGEPELVTLHAGYWASRAGLPPPPAGPRARQVQLTQLRFALPWSARLLHLPPPDLSSA